jgi:hypothetical protein
MMNGPERSKSEGSKASSQLMGSHSHGKGFGGLQFEFQPAMSSGVILNVFHHG